MKKRSIFLILIIFSLLTVGCKYDFILPEEVPPIDNGGDPISFSSQIAPIFAEKCISCHKPGSTSPDLTATNAYTQIVPKYINATTPTSSKIYTYPTSGTHYAKVTATQAALILKWIQEGTKNN